MKSKREEQKSIFTAAAAITEMEAINRAAQYKRLLDCPIPREELFANLGLFLNRQLLSRIIFLDYLYKKIVNVHGVIAEFGVRWGQNLSLFSSFRGMYEPYNYSRKIIGFDTFEGFPNVTEKDGNHNVISEGAYGVTPGYKNYLEEVMKYHESESPLNHIKKFEIVKGDACKTLQQYLEEHPETIFSLVYFDFDIYEPTKKCLELIKPFLTKGSVLGFDELNDHTFPGETLAFKEVFGLDRFEIKRTPLNPMASYVVIK
jgi:hypothetical protein